jgi:5-methylcytosine-specific restriction endonuclease McrA
MAKKLAGGLWRQKDKHHYVREVLRIRSQRYRLYSDITRQHYQLHDILCQPVDEGLLTWGLFHQCQYCLCRGFQRKRLQPGARLQIIQC